MKQILLLLHKQFCFSSFKILFAALLATIYVTGCARNTAVPANDAAKITVLNTADVITTTSDDVSRRSYSFKNIPLQLFFSDAAQPSYIAYGNGFRKDIATLFYSREMAEKNAPHLAAHYTTDRDSFMDEPARNILMEASKITVGNHEYVLCSFDKQQFSIGPLSHYYYYLFDVTNEDAITAIAFTGLAEESRYMPKVYNKNGKIAVELTYYSHLKAGDYSTESVVVTQDGGGVWVME